MHIQFYMTSSLGTINHTDPTYRDFVVLVQGKTFPDDLVRLAIQEWDVIMETDWIAKHKVTWILKRSAGKAPHNNFSE